MTPKEAYEALREFQMWRRSEGMIPEAPPYSSQDLGIALDFAIDAEEGGGERRTRK